MIQEIEFQDHKGKEYKGLLCVSDLYPYYE